MFEKYVTRYHDHEHPPFCSNTELYNEIVPFADIFNVNNTMTIGFDGRVTNSDGHEMNLCSEYQHQIDFPAALILK